MVGMLGCGCCGSRCGCNPQYAGEFSYNFNTLPAELVNIPYENSGDLSGLTANGQLVSTLQPPPFTYPRTPRRRLVGVRSSFQNTYEPPVGCYKEYSVEAYVELTSPSPLAFPSLLQSHIAGIGVLDETGFLSYIVLQTQRLYGGGYYTLITYRNRTYINGFTVSSTLLNANLKIKITEGYAINDWYMTGYVNSTPIGTPDVYHFPPPQCDFWPFLWHESNIHYNPVPGGWAGSIAVATFDDFKQTFVVK